jgi:8-amino-7-oxononanoate synthase
MTSLDKFAAQKLAALDAERLRRSLVETSREDGVWVERDGRRLLSFSCNDYLGLTHHPN